MPMTQEAIRQHYEGAWQQKNDAASNEEIRYSDPVEDAVLYPIYRQMIADQKVLANEGEILDVGAGSGRWIRFFLENFRPKRLMGVDYTQASVSLLRRWFPPEFAPATELAFSRVDICEPNLDLQHRFDLINIANVLFHIPEQDKFDHALANLARHLKPGGIVATTEYLPRTSMRTEWMLVRDRYTFERQVKQAGMRIVATRAFGIFTNDPVGIDGPDNGTRGQFNQVRHLMQTLRNAVGGADGAQFLTQFYSQIETAILSFCRERIPDMDMPSQKLVFLAKDA